MDELLARMVVVSNLQKLRKIQRLAIELEAYYNQPILEKKAIEGLTEELKEEVNSLLRNTLE